MINYNNKKFRAVENSSNGEVEGTTEFEYKQEGDVVWATYKGANIKLGTLTGFINKNEELEFHYQHVNHKNEIMTGKCHSTPEILNDGRIRLHEKWQWTCKDFSEGTSLIEEVKVD